jgi:hypothetical protein
MAGKMKAWITVALMLSSVRVGMADGLDTATAERFAKLALACVEREYPGKIAHTLNSDEDVRPPRELSGRTG